MASKQEQAVRDYLAYLTDPNSYTVDTSKLEAMLESTVDPLERLEIRAKITEVSDVLPSLEQSFVDNAKAWADKKNVSAAMFLAEGVEPAVLRKAGFRIPRNDSAPSSKKRSQKRVTAEQIAASLPRKGAKFTIASVQEASGGSPATVRKLINQMTDEGTVESLGPDPNHSGPGRAATLYKRL